MSDGSIFSLLLPILWVTVGIERAICRDSICRKDRCLLAVPITGLEFPSSLWKLMAAGLCRKMNSSVSSPGNGAIYPPRLPVGLQVSRLCTKQAGLQMQFWGKQFAPFGIWEHMFAFAKR